MVGPVEEIFCSVIRQSVCPFITPPLRALEAGRQARQPKNSKKQGKGTADWFPNGSFPNQKIKIKHHTRFQLNISKRLKVVQSQKLD